MGFNDFWIDNNGKKEQLNNAKHGVRKEQVDKKYHNLFDAYDVNGDGTLEENELQGLFTGLTRFSGADKMLDAAENKQVASLFAEKINIKDADFMGFVKSISDAAEEIVSSETSKDEDGGEIITTTYKNGMVETIHYYPDGEFKLKTQKQDSVTETTTYLYTDDGKNYKKCTKAELDKMIKDGYKKQRAAEQRSDSMRMTFEEGYRSSFMKAHNVIPQTNRNEIHIDNTDMSERAKAEAEIRDFVISHYVQTHKDCQSALDTMGILDDIGAAINAGAGELWNSCKNIYNKHFGDGTESDYQNFYELVKKFEPNYDKALVAEGGLEGMREHPVGYFTGETGRIDVEKGLQFQQTTEQYQNATILKARIDILKNAMLEISMYENEQNALTYAPAQSEGMNPASHILKANKLLLQYFDGDKETVNMLLSGTIGNAQSTINAIKGIADDTQKMFDTVTNGKSFDEIKKDYQNQYKEMYKTDFVPDELTEKIMDAKATGGMVKLAVITAISVLITKSPVMAQISATAGGVEVTGAAANMIRTLASRYGATAVQQGIKFAMTSGTLATDVGLTLLNQVTSERGVNGEELWESAKGSAKYIYFGAYIGAPLAQAVSKQLGKIGATTKMLEGGVKSVNGAIQTTSITGNKLVQNLMKVGNKVLTKVGAFLTDVAAFSALEVATEGMDPGTAAVKQTEMLGKLKIMNHFIEYMLGGKVHAGMSKAQMDAAIERSGVKNWQIKEISSPNKTVYEVQIEEGLPPMRFEDKNQLATAMLERVAGSYSATNKAETNTKTEQKTPIDIKNLKIEKASDEDLKEIQKIDLEAFEGNYTIDSDFEVYKTDLEKQGISTYAIKSEDGQVIGYYQLEPVQSGELYIHSIGVRADLRNTKASYAALRQMQTEITKFAKGNNIKKVTLDVDANKPELVKLYKKFGFDITDETSGTEAGQQYHDYHMEANVKKVLGKETVQVTGVKADEVQPVQAPETNEVIKPAIIFAGYKFKDYILQHLREITKEPADAEYKLEEIQKQFDNSRYSFDEDKSKAYTGRFFSEYGEPPAEGYIIHKKVSKGQDKLEFIININPNTPKEVIEGLKPKLINYFEETVIENKIDEAIVKVDPNNKVLIEWLESQGFSQEGIAENHFADGSHAIIFSNKGLKDKQIIKYFEDNNLLENFETEEHKNAVLRLCQGKTSKYQYDNILKYYQKAKNKELFTIENIDKVYELAEKYKLDKNFIDMNISSEILSKCTSISEIEEIMSIRSRLVDPISGEVYNTSRHFSIEAAKAQTKVFEQREVILQKLGIDEKCAKDFIGCLINDVTSVDSIDAIIKAGENNVFKNSELAPNNIRTIGEFTSILSKLRTENDVKLLKGIVEKLTFGKNRYGNEPMRELYDLFINTNISQKYSFQEAAKMITSFIDKFENKNINLNCSDIMSITAFIKDKDYYNELMNTLDILSKPEVQGLEHFKAMFCSDNPPNSFDKNVLKHFRALDGLKLSNVSKEELRLRLWYSSQCAPNDNTFELEIQELKANSTIPDNLKMYCWILDRENPQNIYEELSKYPKERVEKFAESGLLRVINAHNMNILNTDVDFELIKKYNLVQYIKNSGVISEAIAKLNLLDENKLSRMKEFSLFKKAYKVSDLVNFANIEDTNFVNIAQRNLLTIKKDKFDLYGLDSKQIQQAANLSEVQWHKFNLPSSTAFNVRLLLAKLEDSQVKDLNNLIDYLKNNKKILQQVDMENLDDKKVEALIMNETNLPGVVSVIQITGGDVLKHAAQLKFNGFDAFLRNASSLNNLPQYLREKLRNKLQELPHPEQKIEKLQMIASLSQFIKPEQMEAVIDDIKSTKMSKVQKDKADVIFLTTKPYEQQVENFIKEFDVPPNRQHTIREFLLNANLNEKFVTPPIAEEQIAVINKKIQSIMSNDKIPENKKQAYLAMLTRQIEDIRSNSDEYTRPRINDRALKPLEQQVEAHINIPNSQREFNTKLNATLYNVLGIETTPELLNDIQYDNKYFSRLFTNNSEFRPKFQQLIELIKANPNSRFTDIIRNIPENQMTQNLFRENGLDYERWLRFDENSHQQFTVKIDVQKAVQEAKKNLLAEFTSELGYSLDANEIAKLNNIMKEQGIANAGQKDLPKIIKALENEFKTNDYWKQNTPEIQTFKDHIEIHKKNIHAVEQLKDTSEELFVRLWDKDDVGRNIFFGNHVGCCTSVGNSNSFAAPQHLMNSFVNGIEIVDRAGNSMGNSMCYFAKVDGKLTFIIDSFEANGKLGASPEVTDAIIDYAKQVCAEMGRPDANIMFGPNYNKVDFTRCILTDGHTIEVIGRAPENTYIDCTGGRSSINSIIFNRKMNEIMDL